MKPIYIFLLVLIVIAAIVGYKLYTTKDNKKVSGGTPPNQDDISCAEGAANRKIIGSCTKPVIYPVPSYIKQKCFTSDQLGLSEGDSGPSKVTESNGFGQTWYFNYQAGDRFCYTNKQSI